MLEVTLKYIAYFSGGFLFFVFAWWRTKDRRYLVGTVIYSVVFFPVFFSQWWLNSSLIQHNKAFDRGDCIEAIHYAEEALQYPLYEYVDRFTEEVGGFSPRLTFLLSIGICQYKQHNYIQAIDTLNSLVSYASRKNYEAEYIDGYLKIIEKAQEKINQNLRRLSRRHK